jgi:hypothetical protein
MEFDFVCVRAGDSQTILFIPQESRLSWRGVVRERKIGDDEENDMVWGLYLEE